MVDMHNDLLTLAYTCYLSNDYTPLIEFNNKIKEGEVKAIVANLYFMSLDEMKQELHEKYYGYESIVDMFIRSKKILNEYIPDVDYLYSIEGCDYLEISDLKRLKEEGLDSILLVWNCPNKYGSGNRDTYGLTELGKEFINEAINLKLGIDLSHANKKTYLDIIDIVSKRKYYKVYCSHSNIRNLFDNNRNLDNEQLYMLNSVNGFLGLVTTNLFVKDEDEFIEHIKYAAKFLGVDKVLIASDNMDYTCIQYKDTKLFDYQNMNKRLRYKLRKYFDEEQIEKILYENGINLFSLIRSE